MKKPKRNYRLTFGYLYPGKEYRRKKKIRFERAKMVFGKKALSRWSDSGIEEMKEMQRKINMRESSLADHLKQWNDDWMAFKDRCGIISPATIRTKAEATRMNRIDKAWRKAGFKGMCHKWKVGDTYYLLPASEKVLEFMQELTTPQKKGRLKGINQKVAYANRAKAR